MLQISLYLYPEPIQIPLTNTLFKRTNLSRKDNYYKVPSITKMASSRSGVFCISAFIALVLLFNAIPSIMAAEEFKVGDALGWRQPSTNETDMYNLWASRKKFHVGDSLRFEYKNDSVLVVDKWDYYHCNTSSPIRGYTDGNNTLIRLDKPGPIYFVSGDSDHCKDGQRLLIEVLPLHPSHSPPAIAGPPESPSETSPAPSPLSNSGTTISSVGGVVSISLVAFVATLMG